MACPAGANERPTPAGQLACADPRLAFELEVEAYVRTRVLDWARKPAERRALDRRLLLVFDTGCGELVGLVAHQRDDLREGGVDFPVSQLWVVAVARAWQGHRFASGDRISDVVMSAAMRDIDRRRPQRHHRVFAVIHRDNARSLALCQRFGLTTELSPDGDYRRWVTARRQPAKSGARKRRARTR